MIVTGAAFLLFWALMEFFGISLLVAALATGVVLIILGLLFGERLPRR